MTPTAQSPVLYRDHATARRMPAPPCLYSWMATGDRGYLPSVHHNQTTWPLMTPPLISVKFRFSPQPQTQGHPTHHTHPHPALGGQETHEMAPILSTLAIPSHCDEIVVSLTSYFWPWLCSPKVLNAVSPRMSDSIDRILN